MKVALFGGTGFVGSYIIDELISQNLIPRVLVRNNSESKLVNKENCQIINGDINDISAINDTIEGCEAVIYNIGIIRQFVRRGISYENLHFQGAKRCIDAAKNLGVKRFILMSANGVTHNGTGYQSTKMLAEEYLKWADLDYTIFRPSLVFGDPRGEERPEFCTQLKKDMLSLPFPAPSFHKGLNPLNGGKFALSPIHAKDVSKIFVDSIKEEQAIKKTFPLGGDAYYWNDVIKIISKACGKNKWTIPAPVFPIKAIAGILERFSWFPITKDQLTMLIEGNVCDSTE